MEDTGAPREDPGEGLPPPGVAQAHGRDASSRPSKAAPTRDTIYRHLFEHSLGLMCVHDLDGIVLAINPAAAEALGITPEEAIGRNVKEALAPSARSRFEGYLRRIRQNPSDSGLMRVVAKGGRQRVWRNVRFEEPGRSPLVLGHALDITERVSAEQALQESEGRFRLMADTAPVMIWVSDVGGRWSFVSRGWLDFTGRRLEQEIGEGWLADVHPDDVAWCREAHRVSARILQPFTRQYRLRRSDGEYRWVQDTGVPRVASDGAVAGYIGAATDIADVKQAQAALKRAHDELSTRVAERTADLERANERLHAEIRRRMQTEAALLRVKNLESLSVLAGRLAHEFNNALTVILGNLTLAQLQALPGSSLSTTLARIQTAGERAARVTAQLLAFARGGAPVCRAASLGELLAQVGPDATQGHSARLVVDLPPGLWPLHVDPDQLRQALHQVLVNAVQATPGSGLVEVRAENVAVREPIGAIQPGNYVRLVIRDTGRGIPPEEIPRIFDPYFTTKTGHTGLGLATASAILTRHHGSIDVDSTVGAGTTVSLCIPAVPESGVGHRSETGRPAHDGGRILVMDDEAPVRELAATLLSRLGYDVECAHDGADAIARYRGARAAGRPFTAVILDLTVADGMGGKEAVRALRDIDAAVVAIVSSGYCDDPIMAEFEQHGFRGVLPKPWTLEQLSDVLARSLRMPS